MTPRSDWPTLDYGWLKDYHMGAAMTMFRKRFMRDPSQYPNQRIAFLDQDFITSMKIDFLQFEPSHKNFLFRKFYEDQLNGTAPIGSATNKKWYIHVDNLYACLFVNGNHWVALDINLEAKKIYVYDSIPSIVRDAQLALQCLFLRRMIPALLSQVLPDEVRKKSYVTPMFEFWGLMTWQMYVYAEIYVKKVVDLFLCGQSFVFRKWGLGKERRIDQVLKSRVLVFKGEDRSIQGWDRSIQSLTGFLEFR